MDEEIGRIAVGDRATHERSQSTFSPPSVGIPCAEARERAERFLAHVIDCKKEAIESVAATWDAKIENARRELKDAIEAEQAIYDGLSEWTIHDGGDCPVGEVRVLFRTKWEWRDLLSGKTLPLTGDVPRYADTLRWPWSGKDWDDIAAYKVVSDSDTRPKDGDAKQGSARE